jgi:hypothetical protein
MFRGWMFLSSYPCVTVLLYEKYIVYEFLNNTKMKTTLTLKKNLLLLAIYCISANAQTTKGSMSDQYSRTAQKLSQDIILTDAQKSTIKVKIDSISQKHQNSKMGIRDSLYMKDMNAVRKEIFDSVLTQEQKLVFSQKFDNKKQEIVNKIQSAH